MIKEVFKTKQMKNQKENPKSQRKNVEDVPKH